MIIHFTPVHRQVLTLVRDRQIIWRSLTGPYGGFSRADGSRIPPSDQLVALYELRNANMITVNTVTSIVAVTPAGMARLAHWDAQQHRKAS